MQRAVIEIERDNATANSVGIHDEIDREIFDKELGFVLQ